MPLPQHTNRAQLYYDGHCPLCAREMAFLRRVDKIYQRWADRRYCRNYSCAVAQGVRP